MDKQLKIELDLEIEEELKSTTLETIVCNLEKEWAAVHPKKSPRYNSGKHHKKSEGNEDEETSTKAHDELVATSLRYARFICYKLIEEWGDGANPMWIELNRILTLLKNESFPDDTQKLLYALIPFYMKNMDNDSCYPDEFLKFLNLLISNETPNGEIYLERSISALFNFITRHLKCVLPKRYLNVKHIDHVPEMEICFVILAKLMMFVRAFNKDIVAQLNGCLGETLHFNQLVDCSLNFVRSQKPRKAFKIHPKIIERITHAMVAAISFLKCFFIRYDKHLIEGGKLKEADQIEKSLYSTWIVFTDSAQYFTLKESSYAEIFNNFDEIMVSILQSFAALSNTLIEKFEKFNDKLSIYCATFVLFYSKCDNSVVQAEAARCMAVYLDNPSIITDNYQFLLDSLEIIIAYWDSSSPRGKDNFLWAAANLADTFRKYEGDEQFTFSLFCDFCRIGKRAIEDALRFKKNVYRICGALFQLVNKSFVAEPQMVSLIEELTTWLANELSKNSNDFKARWNAAFSFQCLVGSVVWMEYKDILIPKVLQSICKALKYSTSIKEKQFILHTIKKISREEFGDFLIELFPLVIDLYHLDEWSNIEDSCLDRYWDNIDDSITYLESISTCEDLKEMDSELNARIDIVSKLYSKGLLTVEKYNPIWLKNDS